MLEDQLARRVGLRFGPRAGLSMNPACAGRSEPHRHYSG
jgi:hypothetical protein